MRASAAWGEDFAGNDLSERGLRRSVTPVARGSDLSEIRQVRENGRHREGATLHER